MKIAFLLLTGAILTGLAAVGGWFQVEATFVLPLALAIFGLVSGAVSLAEGV